MKLIEIYKSRFAMVDDEDFNRINNFSWHLSKATHNLFYARTPIFDSKSKCFKKHLMHRLIMNINNSKIKVDHIDGDGLNNQKINLRICSASQNMFNRRKAKNCSSKYKGVCFRPKENQYMARLNFENKPIYIGRYDNEIEAALAYNVAASFYFREFAKLNQVEV